MGKKFIEDRLNVHKDIKSELFKLKDITNIENQETALIFDKLTYAIFGMALMPQSTKSLVILEKMSSIYVQALDFQGDWFFSPDVENIINETYFTIKSTLPPIIGVQKASKILREQLKYDPFHNGIELGTLCKVMDLNKTPYLKEGLPYYSRLGLGYHANRCINEEWQLLSDSFYYIALAKTEYKKMITYKK